MKHGFKVGDTVRVINTGSPPGHYLLIGTIVTVVEVDVVNQGDFTINVQGTEDSFVENEMGWYCRPFGKHCQAVTPYQIELVCRTIPTAKKYTYPQIPNI